MPDVFQAHRELVGRRIRAARIEAGLSHDRLAARVGTSRQHLIKLEKGAHLARPNMLARIAAATDKPSGSWFERADDDEEDSSMPTTAEQRELMDVLMRPFKTIDRLQARVEDLEARLAGTPAARL